MMPIAVITSMTRPPYHGTSMASAHRLTFSPSTTTPNMANDSRNTHASRGMSRNRPRPSRNWASACRERSRLGHPLAPAQRPGPHELPEAERKQIVRHEPDHRGAVEAVDRDAPPGGHQPPPAQRANPEPEQRARHDRREPDHAGVAQRLPNLGRADVLHGEPDAHGRDA